MSEYQASPREAGAGRLDTSPAGLNSLQRAIVQMLAQGFSDSHVANRLGVGLRTVQRHVSHIMRVLEARSRFEAGVAAARAGLVDDRTAGSGRHPEATARRPAPRKNAQFRGRNAGTPAPGSCRRRNEPPDAGRP